MAEPPSAGAGARERGVGGVVVLEGGASPCAAPSPPPAPTRPHPPLGQAQRSLRTLLELGGANVRAGSELTEDGETLVRVCVSVCGGWRPLAA